MNETAQPELYEAAEPERAEVIAEWQEVHLSIERYEGAALWLKLSAVLLVVFYLTSALGTLWCLLLLFVLWLMEGIWRTSQLRLVTRIENLEALLASDTDVRNVPFQLYREFAASRGSVGALLGEYVGNALRPTVAYPYGVIVGLVVLAWIF